MSAFVVADRTINRIVAFLAKPNDGWYSDPARPFLELGYALRSDRGSWEQRKRLAADLFDLNCRAVDARYEDHPARSEFHPEEFVFRHEAPPRGLEAVQRMSCLCYQCSEADIPEDPLYKALDQARLIAALACVQALPEYDRTIGWE